MLNLSPKGLMESVQEFAWLFFSASLGLNSQPVQSTKEITHAKTFALTKTQPIYNQRQIILSGIQGREEARIQILDFERNHHLTSRCNSDLYYFLIFVLLTAESYCSPTLSTLPALLSCSPKEATPFLALRLPNWRAQSRVPAARSPIPGTERARDRKTGYKSSRLT